MCNACTPILVGMASLVLEILLLLNFGQTSLSYHGGQKIEYWLKEEVQFFAVILKCSFVVVMIAKEAERKLKMTME